MDITGKKVTIIGGKRSGTACARLIVRLKGNARLSDQDDESCLPQGFKEWASQNNVILELGGHTRAFIEESDLIVVSPGVPFNAKPLQWAREKGIPLLGEIEFAAQFCTKPIIAVTGSNGKTTVSTLISQVLEKSGRTARLCGNVGFPFCGYVLDLQDVDYVVLEVSSFQLESVLDSTSPFIEGLNIKGFRPHIAVILNFSQNHLDRHKDLEEYFEAKKRIFLNQEREDYLVLNGQDAQSRKIATQGAPQIVYFNGADKPLFANPNYCAVYEACRILGVDRECCRKVFEEFKGVEHRLELVRNLDGIDFINDSKATTAQAGLWALASIDRPVVMICGGRDKNIDFSVLAQPVRAKVKHMFVIGEARKKLRKTFEDIVHLDECEGLEEAVSKARLAACHGDCVLLSPMCASFDMFKDFEDRGRVFKEIVRRLE